MKLSNFYKPASKRVQQIAAALKGIGGVLMAATLIGMPVWLPVAGLFAAAIGEGLEKLSAKDTPAAQ